MELSEKRELDAVLTLIVVVLLILVVYIAVHLVILFRKKSPPIKCLCAEKLTEIWMEKDSKERKKERRIHERIKELERGQRRVSFPPPIKPLEVVKSESELSNVEAKSSEPSIKPIEAAKPPEKVVESAPPVAESLTSSRPLEKSPMVSSEKVVAPAVQPASTKESSQPAIPSTSRATTVELKRNTAV